MTSPEIRVPAAPGRTVGEADLHRVVGLAAIGFSLLYLASDVLEAVQGGFSTLRLSLTYASEAAIPLFVLGLCVVQRSTVGRLGVFGAATYAYAYVFFTSTVVYALVARTPDYQAVTDAFGPWMTVHGVVMVVGGVAFGVAVVRAEVLPRWTGVALAVGVVLVAAASGLPTLARTAAEAVPAIAFVGMGLAVLRSAAPVGDSHGLVGIVQAPSQSLPGRSRR